ncbi:MAG: ATP-binding protein [Clostridium sp.]|uniref:AlbA family DNA-binding domain-containing protein n=1 Tax=Clostridium sp. TaxID=1506 RepID=UPI0028FEF913|nr:ATP-binding protein [Clostridium sp.]MDU2895707.1 ATP-binding protein [Clostridium sp.]MDU3008099.1 ATP-binding protein [Clostridium sp.]MDU3037952.1 ATP-binding protein [Clostridium sp.]MDU3052932.1 ATP-binding protein [Clostridium sp.]
MRRLSKIRLKEIIDNEQECTYIDFKKVQYRKENYTNLIKDIMSMANAEYSGEKYIVIGVKSIPGEKNNVVGIDEQIIDDSIYQQTINENIEPNINFSYYYENIDNKKIAYFIIYDDNVDRPYMIKKDSQYLKRGDAFKRIGSSQRKLIKSDFDGIYMNKYNNQIEYNREIEKCIGEINLELNFIEKLKEYNNYLLRKNNEILILLDSYKSCIRDSRWSLRNIPNTMSEREWKNKTLIDITSFTITPMDIEVDERMLRIIDTEYFKEYNNIISDMKNDYVYLEYLQKELQNLKTLTWDFNNYDVNSAINKIFTKQIYDNFHISQYFHFGFNYTERVNELKERLNELKSKIKLL